MSLSEDCIREIIEYLSEDKRSLYSCLLTNRLFCRFVIPILWRNPWINIDLKCIDSKEKNYWNILGRTIIKCFLQEIKNSPFLLKKFNKDLLLLLQKQPLFNYVLYIQIISLDINIITCPEEIILELSKNIHNLKRIEFCLDNIESENSIYHNSTISDLSDSDSEDISIMSEENSKYNDNISTLILSQKNLREIKFIYVRSMVNLFKKKTIEHLSNSLRILELCNCTYLPIQAITNFINLTELKICFHSFDYNEDDVNDNNFKGVYLSKLEILSLLNFREKDLIFVAKLIETTKDTLKILNIRPHTNNAIEVITNNTTYTIDTTLLSRNTSPSPLSIEYYLHAIKMVCSNIEVLPVCLDNVTVKEIVRELKIQREVDFHDNIIRCYGITKLETDNHNNYWLVMEYADGGNLRCYLKENFTKLSWDDKYKMAHQLSCAVSCLHNEGIVHRDLHSCEQYDIGLALDISQGHRETVVPDTPDEYVKIYTKCWNGEPDNRPTIYQVVDWN
ncbi:kinase-like domain-containing protein [Rhizophagus irregularis DAOM 181602=DAOM 197198]|nr:kinase-like domain-containing protein [Rhizophagus irregularis DAOM 181602=DAOM 197198]